MYLKGLGYLVVSGFCWIGIAVLRMVEPADEGLLIHGIVDEAGHLMTALMLAVGLRSMRLPVPIWSVLTGGVVLDIGHLFSMMDVLEPVTGSTRSGTQSVFVVGILALVGFIDQRHANVWLGITIGALSHLWRDMGTGLVPLAWPFVTDQLWGTSFTRYMVGTLGLSAATIGSGLLLDIYYERTSSSYRRPAPRDNQEVTP
jgi:hypothetical protein